MHRRCTASGVNVKREQSRSRGCTWLVEDRPRGRSSQVGSALPSQVLMPSEFVLAWRLNPISIVRPLISCFAALSSKNRRDKIFQLGPEARAENWWESLMENGASLVRQSLEPQEYLDTEALSLGDPDRRWEFGRSDKSAPDHASIKPMVITADSALVNRLAPGGSVCPAQTGSSESSWWNHKTRD